MSGVRSFKMASLDYVGLRDEASVKLMSPLKLAGGLLGTALALGGSLKALASGVKYNLFQGNHEYDTDFVPKSGVDYVLVRVDGRAPGSLSMLSPSLAGPSCLFAYGPLEPTRPDDQGNQPFASGAKIEEGWLYGAVFDPQLNPWAYPTGNPEDVLIGRLFCWSSVTFYKKLQIADEYRNYDPRRPEATVLRRGTVWVVRRDGSAAKAYWYYMEPQDVQNSLTGPAPLAGADGEPLSFYTVNDPIMGGRSQSAVAKAPNGAIRFEGVISTRGGGFASMRSDLPNGLPDEVVAVALTTSGGDGREYKLFFHQQTSNNIPFNYEAKFKPDPSVERLRSCFVLKKDFKPTLRGNQLPISKPPQPRALRTVGLVLNHVSGYNKETYGQACPKYAGQFLTGMRASQVYHFSFQVSFIVRILTVVQDQKLILTDGPAESTRHRVRCCGTLFSSLLNGQLLKILFVALGDNIPPNLAPVLALTMAFCRILVM
eukprot:g66135.t1